MKKIILFIACFNAMQFTQAQTATDFTATDCAGLSHNLFSELNAGKVIVLDWVMPCGSCIGPSLTAYNIVQSYSTSNPGKVFFYLLDDFANTACTPLDGWASSNGIGIKRTTFSDAAATQTPYGGTGMPKIVIVGGGNHTVYFNADGAAAGVVSDIQNAINAALVVSGVEQIHAADFNLSVYNLSAQNILVNYSIEKPGDVTFEIHNSLGQSVKSLKENKQVAGSHQTEIFFDKSLSGIYFLEIATKENTGFLKFIISN